ncbi:MAG: sulfatase [Planctomycetota bacterium]
MDRPNILLITDDQHRFDFFEGGAAPGLRAPALARLRREGTTLTHAYSACPLCVPTRFTWWYGLRASQGNGAWGDFDDQWPQHLPSIGHALQGAGYHTAIIGKVHSHSGLRKLDLVARRQEIHDRGFDDVVEMSGKSLVAWFDCTYTRHLEKQGRLETYRARLAEDLHLCDPLPFPPEDSMDGLIGRHARAWLEGYDGAKPFFLHASFCNPHFPYDPPQPYAARYRAEEMPPPEGVEDPDAIARYREIRAAYCALIEHCDHEIGALLEALDRRGLAENTIVVFTTDHGDMMGHRNRKGKCEPFDTSVRTPVTARWPGRIPAGVERDALAESIDLPCTLLEAAGLGADATAHFPSSPGLSYWNVLLGKTDHHRDWAFSEMGPWKLCADQRWKFVHRADGEDLLFDREADPWELDNRIADPAQADRVRAMQRQLITSLGETVAPPTQPIAGKGPFR